MIDALNPAQYILLIVCDVVDISFLRSLQPQKNRRRQLSTRYRTRETLCSLPLPLIPASAGQSQ